MIRGIFNRAIAPPVENDRVIIKKSDLSYLKTAKDLMAAVIALNALADGICHFSANKPRAIFDFVIAAGISLNFCIRIKAQPYTDMRNPTGADAV